MIDLSPFAEAFRSLDASLTFLLLFGMVFMFTAQIFAWITPPKPKFLHALAFGIVAGALVMLGLYYFFPLAPALVNACIVGAYGYPGYMWILSMMFLLSIFGLNALASWKKNRPLEVIS